MPTGYTSDIYECKEVSGKQFLTTCARAFGATIMMRDEPLDTPIPEEFPVDDHYEKQLKIAQEELKKYQNMSIEEAEKLVEEFYQDEIDRNEKYYNKKLALKERYEKVLTEVKQWQPPTSEHNSLKEYAINQLTESIDFDCGNLEEYLKEIKKPTPQEYIKSKIDHCIWEVNYYTKDWMEEIKRTNERNLWIKQLRESLQ